MDDHFHPKIWKVGIKEKKIYQFFRNKNLSIWSHSLSEGCWLVVNAKFLEKLAQIWLRYEYHPRLTIKQIACLSMIISKTWVQQIKLKLILRTFFEQKYLSMSLIGPKLSASIVKIYNSGNRAYPDIVNVFRWKRRCTLQGIPREPVLKSRRQRRGKHSQAVNQLKTIPHFVYLP